MSDKYIVIAGDTLSRICKKIYGKFDNNLMQKLIIENNISNPNKIKVGQILFYSLSENDSPISNTEESQKKHSVENDFIFKEVSKEKYFQGEFKKTAIVLHLTAGYNWQGAYNTFANKIATPFIVDKSGPKHIVQLFDEKYWAYHLGQKEFTNNWFNDKRSMGIEIVNVGPVWFQNGIWRDCWQKKKNSGSTAEQSIIKGENRDAQGGVIFPDEQVDAVCNLVNYLCDKWNIPRQVPKNKMSFQLPALNSFEGIIAHMMFRRQGKYDMGPAWPWQTLIEQCNLKEIDL